MIIYFRTYHSYAFQSLETFSTDPSPSVFIVKDLSSHIIEWVSIYPMLFMRLEQQVNQIVSWIHMEPVVWSIWMIYRNIPVQDQFYLIFA